MKVFKYEFPVEDSFEIEMPMMARILSVQVQKGVTCIWALVDEKGQLETRSFSVVGTGHDINFNILEYVGTFQLLGGQFVGHLFERIR